MLRIFKVALAWRIILVKLNYILVKKEGNITTYEFDLDVSYNRNATLKYKTILVQDVPDEPFKVKEQGLKNPSEFKEDNLVALINPYE